MDGNGGARLKRWLHRSSFVSQRDLEALGGRRKISTKNFEQLRVIRDSVRADEPVFSRAGKRKGLEGLFGDSAWLFVRKLFRWSLVLSGWLRAHNRRRELTSERHSVFALFGNTSILLGL